MKTTMLVVASAMVVWATATLGGCGDGPSDLNGGDEGGGGAGGSAGTAGSMTIDASSGRFDVARDPDGPATGRDSPRADVAVDKPAAKTDTAPIVPAGRCNDTSQCPPMHRCQLDHVGCHQSTPACKSQKLDIYCGDYLGDCLPMNPACADINAPVCSCDLKTYKNRCVAYLAGAQIALTTAACPK